MKRDFRVLLVGNYRLDGQLSMLGYHDLLLRELTTRGVAVSSIEPAPFFGAVKLGGLTKWLRYLDKYLLFPSRLRRRLHEENSRLQPGEKLLVHITDHSNAPYRRHTGTVPTVATCHDLLAVRGALGEDTDCPASAFGKLLQRSILHGLRGLDRVLCVSAATQADLRRLAPEVSSEVIPLPLNRSYSILPPAEAIQRLEQIDPRLNGQAFILHVGSSLRRKNREGILRAFASIRERWSGNLVFAGEKLPPELTRHAASLHIANRVIELPSPPGPILEALYNRAHCLFFPSRAEGFGWPIIEAQACGCPVLIARTTSLPEVAGAGALIRDLHDEQGFAEDLLRLDDPPTRATLLAAGQENLRRFQTSLVLEQYLDFYQTVAGKSVQPEEF